MGSTSIEQPSQPSAPSAAQNAADYNTMLENQYQQALKYAPLQAQQAVDLANQYALPYAEAYKKAQEAMYPGTTALQEQLANTALTGMSSGMSPDVRSQYLSDIRANLGTNVGSPIGAVETARGLAQMNEDWKRYYQNLGLSMTSRQPLTQATTPSTTDYMGQANLGQTMGYNQGIYGTNAGIYGNQNNLYGQMSTYNPWANAIGSIGGGIAGAYTGGLLMQSGKK